jgi:hypothetical protein
VIARGREAKAQAERGRKAQEDSAYAHSFPVWASKTNKLYFANHRDCLYAATLPDWDRVLFATPAEAQRAGYLAHESDVRCRVGMPRPTR